MHKMIPSISVPGMKGTCLYRLPHRHLFSTTISQAPLDHFRSIVCRYVRFGNYFFYWFGGGNIGSRFFISKGWCHDNRMFFSNTFIRKVCHIPNIMALCVRCNIQVGPFRSSGERVIRCKRLAYTTFLPSFGLWWTQIYLCNEKIDDSYAAVYFLSDGYIMCDLPCSPNMN